VITSKNGVKIVLCSGLKMVSISLVEEMSKLGLVGLVGGCVHMCLFCLFDCFCSFLSVW